MRRQTSKIMALALAILIALIASPCVPMADAKDGDESNRPHRARQVREREAKKRSKSWNGPLLSNYELYQIGADEVVLGLTGRGLPEPELYLGRDRVRIVLYDCRIDRADMIDRSVVVPMVSDIRIDQMGEDVVIEMRTTGPLHLRTIRGEAPANDYMFRFIAEEAQDRARDEPMKTRPQVQAPPPPGPFQSSTPITLDLRDTELRDVFRMLGTHLNKNVIIDPSLPSALVTMTLKNVPMSEAFDYLMKTYDITWHMVGKDTMVIGTQDGLSRLSGNEETRMFKVAYGDVNVIQGLLVNLTKIPADRFAADPRQKAIYVTSTPAKLMEVSNALQKLDKPSRQVMIYAKIFEFSEGATKQVETALNAVYNHWWFSYSGLAGGRGGYVDDNRLGRNLNIRDENSAILPNITDLQTPMHGIWREFDVALRAVEDKNQGKTLANPSVVTMDGQEASVTLTEDYPYISDRDEAGNPTWSTETVGPQLTFTPRIGRDRMITMQLALETGEVIEMITGSTGEQMPRTSTRRVTTQVEVRSGQPFVVGGLFRDNQSTQVTRIPVLGNLPLLGELFTYRDKQRRKTQVVMLVVPYILDVPDAAVEQEILVRSQH
ncbi:MAG: hypothetical protein IJR14_10570 [Synergistaceae bacterium]|nr:hypothetical protein [Synergistaceae bacterium]